ncbi:MAG: glutamine--fructose-6-phosphate transaminase (isomerizing) [Chloroflexi bacterium]|nr:glutamine--fructose-6-phosphate transaminase (isomerizing) [Chloroflexota bacterium]
MCGIVGYIGRRQAQPVLFNCLSKLEYRGYDSCGIALLGDSIQVCKDEVRVKALEKALPPIAGLAGIGHTRWATHGEPSRANAHPHCDCTGRIAVVHNGVISNFQRLKDKLISTGHVFASETDTEVLPHLIESYYQGDLEEAVERSLADIEGSYAIIAVVAGEAKLVVARKDSPLIIGIGDRENFVASDVPAILDYTSRVVYLEDGDIALVTADGVRVRENGARIDRAEHLIQWSVADAQKSGYEHFMLKEIHEQPRVIRDTLREYISADGLAAEVIPSGEGGLENMLIAACGTSYHAALIGKYIIEQLVRVPVKVELASEFNYCGQVPPGSNALVITQSGETADALKTMKKLKEAGCQVLAITNVVGSTASRIADHVIYTRAGPEISVAATKSFISQLVALYWMALPHARVDLRTLDELIMELRQLPARVQEVLDNEAAIREHARRLARFNDVFFIGRGANYPVALEGALKLKEVSYIHAEGYAAGELKHGPFALLGAEAPVVAILASDHTGEAMLTSIKEIRARKSPLIAVVEEGNEAAGEIADSAIIVPRVNQVFSPVINTVALQLLAYYAARERGCPIDFPRNLAKSVTVE